MVISNLPFEKWAEVPVSERLIGALLDRLTLHIYTPDSDLQDISIVSDHLVQHRVHEEAQKESRDEACDNDDREWLLRVGTDARGKGRRQKPQASNQRGHHDGTQPQERSLAGRRADIFVFETEFVDVGDKNDCGFDRHAHEREQPERR